MRKADGLRWKVEWQIREDGRSIAGFTTSFFAAARRVKSRSVRSGSKRKKKDGRFFFIVGNAGLRLVMDDASLIEREQDVVGG
jgi:hypothetical protein